MNDVTVQSQTRVCTELVCTARWVESIDELNQLIPKWDALAENSIWRNPTFESNFLIPALKYLNDVEARVLIVECVDPDGAEASKSPNHLIGLVPLVRKRIYGMPISAMEIWKHDQSFDSTPLIKRGFGDEALNTILKFLSEQNVGLLGMDTVSAEPEFNSLLKRNVTARGCSFFQRDGFSRAAFRPSENFEKYMTDFTSKNIRKNYRRNHRRLEDLGEIQYEFSNRHSDFSHLATQFLKLEMAGWKGKSGTAFSCSNSSQRFYEEFVLRSAAAGKARFTSLTLDGKPIAMLSDIENGSTVHAFKTAYDPEFAANSPGLQAEIRNVESMHRDGIKFADSCTLSNNSTINRVWGQRVKFQSVVVGLQPGLPQMATQLMPTIQKIAQATRKIANRLKHLVFSKSSK